MPGVEEIPVGIGSVEREEGFLRQQEEQSKVSEEKKELCVFGEIKFMAGIKDLW